ncbi:MAG: hypothetical protein LBK67_08595 [Coriobacteriales bacterium]|jgi:hypothetical protein|nr:hypothetical protein [Coriobacteriales bacterium]
MSASVERCAEAALQSPTAFSTFIGKVRDLAKNNPGFFRSEQSVRDCEKEWEFLDSYGEYAKGRIEECVWGDVEQIWNAEYRQDASILIGQFLQYLKKVEVDVISQIATRAKTAEESLQGFSSFVNDMEFFAVQNPDIFCTEDAICHYQDIWNQLEVLNSVLLCEWEKNRAKVSFVSNRSVEYQPKASKLLNCLIEVLREQIVA